MAAAGAGAGAGAPAAPSAAPAAAAAPQAPSKLLRWHRDPVDTPLLKQLGLKTLYKLLASLTSAPAAALPSVVRTRLLQRLTTLLSGVAPGSLFDDISPPTAEPEEAVPLTATDLIVDSTRSGSTYGIGNVLATGMPSEWMSAQNPSGSTTSLTVTLPTPVAVTHLAFCVADGATPASIKVAVVHHVPGAEGAGQETLLGTVDASAMSQEARLPVSPDQPIKSLRLEFVGFAAANRDKYHGLKSLKLFRRQAFSQHVPAGSLLRQLELWLAQVASTAAPGSADGDAAIAALQALAVATGLLSPLLRTAELLQARPAEASPALVAAGTQCVQALDGQYERVCGVLQSEASSSGTGEINAVFDSMSGGVALTKGGKYVKSTGSNEHALVNVGFERGKASWEFRLEEDTADQECVCFGLGIKPVSRSNYDSSRELWMYRAYNGQVYQRGSSAGPRKAKIHPKDIVRFELDMDAGSGECRAFVNGADQGVIFTGFAGNTVYPAVAFYSSGRAISLVSVQIPTGVKRAFLADLPESLENSQVHGALSKGKALSPGSSRTMLLGGVAAEHGLATPVPSDGCTSVVYKLTADDGYDCFDVVVGLNDPAASDSKDGGGDSDDSDAGAAESKSADDARTVTYSVLGDGRVLASATDTVGPGKPPAMAGHAFMVNIEGVTLLQLKVECAGQASKLRPVWLEPRVRCAPWAFDKAAFDAERAAAAAAAAAAGAAADSRKLMLDILQYLQLFGKQALKAMRTTSPPSASSGYGSRTLPLEAPLSCQAEGHVFQTLARVLDGAVKTMRAHDAGSAQQHAGAAAVTMLLVSAKANLRRLVASGVDPARAGVKLGADGDLSALHNILDSLAGLPGDPPPANTPLSVSMEAANVMDMGLELLYPTEESRTQLLRKLVSGRGGVVEFNFLWPLEVSDDSGDGDGGSKAKEDYRFERAILLLQCHASRLKWQFATHGQFKRSLHLVVNLPPDASVTEFLTDTTSALLKQAGFPQWSFPGGCSDPDINFNIERYLEFDRKDRLACESGVGWVRLYPVGVGSFAAVNARLEAYVDTLAKEVKAKEEEDARRAAVVEAAAEAAPAAAPAPEPVAHGDSDYDSSTDSDEDEDEDTDDDSVYS